MILLDPRRLFKRLAGEIPRELHRHVFVVGSLAVAYHFRDQLVRRAVNTKDADVVVHPAGDMRSCRQMALELLAHGWIRTDRCYPTLKPKPATALRAIRLYPRTSRDYFIELLGLPRKGQTRPVVWAPLRLPDGWYCAPSHRFMSLTAIGRLRSREGLDYAAPEMMALANLLSHPKIGMQRMSEPVQGQQILRASKDLGRVLALAWLAGREETEKWLDAWSKALRACFPESWRPLARRAGAGLERLLADRDALTEAHLTTAIGLLSGKGVSVENLRAVGEQLLADVLGPLARVPDV